MLTELLPWIWDETRLQNLVHGFPAIVLVLVIGVCILVLSKGADWMIAGVVHLARRTGLPRIVIAAAMVAFGTSLPELMTAVAAVQKGYPEIMVGNVVGADVLNCLFVIGAAAVARPLAVPPNFYTFHFPAMILILYPFRAFIFMNKDGRFRKWQGAWLFGVYLIYLILQYAFNIGTVEG